MLRGDSVGGTGGTGGAEGNDADAGMATVWAACAIAALLALAGLVWTLAGVLVTRQHAAGVADLAALAAAGRSVDGETVACAHARDLARAMASRVADCRLRGWDAEVIVHVDVGASLGLGGTVSARARAGPVEQWAGDVGGGIAGIAAADAGR